MNVGVLFIIIYIICIFVLAHEMSESHRKAELMELATTAIPGSSVAERSLLSIHESVLKRLKIHYVPWVSNECTAIQRLHISM